MKQAKTFDKSMFHITWTKSLSYYRSRWGWKQAGILGQNGRKKSFLKYKVYYKVLSQKEKLEYVKLKRLYIPSHFFRCYFRISRRCTMPFPVSVPQCAVILQKTNRLGEQKGGEGCCFVRAYVWRTHPFLSHEGCRATRLKECQSALLNVRVFLQKQERREIAKGGWREVWARSAKSGDIVDGREE